MTVIDNNEASFYLYYIGRYNDKLHYHYGVTYDKTYTELTLMSNGINKFINIYSEPIDHYVYAYDTFKNEVANIGLDTKFSINDKCIDDVFVLKDDYHFNYINSIFCEVFGKK
jgi:hypothetical protein